MSVSPFRAVDEYDIHMDPKNREMIAKVLVATHKRRLSPIRRHHAQPNHVCTARRQRHHRAEPRRQISLVREVA